MLAFSVKPFATEVPSLESMDTDLLAALAELSPSLPDKGLSMARSASFSSESCIVASPNLAFHSKSTLSCIPGLDSKHYLCLTASLCIAPVQVRGLRFHQTVKIFQEAMACLTITGMKAKKQPALLPLEAMTAVNNSCKGAAAS